MTAPAPSGGRSGGALAFMGWPLLSPRMASVLPSLSLRISITLGSDLPTDYAGPGPRKGQGPGNSWAPRSGTAPRGFRSMSVVTSGRATALSMASGGRGRQAQVPLVRGDEGGGEVAAQVAAQRRSCSRLVARRGAAEQVVDDPQPVVVVDEPDQASEPAPGIVDRVVEDRAVPRVVGQDAVLGHPAEEVVPDDDARAVDRRRRPAWTNCPGRCPSRSRRSRSARRRSPARRARGRRPRGRCPCGLGCR